MLIPVVAIIVVLILASALLSWSKNTDEKVAAGIRARNLESQPETETVQPFSTPSAAVVRQSEMVVKVPFGNIFWPIVCAWLFCGALTWVAWKLSTP